MKLFFHEFHLWIDSYTINEKGVTKYYLCTTILFKVVGGISSYETSY